jgi:photosystem II stability/assembly factor-like uncharacterized protein
MAKAGIVYVGTADGLAAYTDPSGKGSWRRRWQTLEGRRVAAILALDEQTLLAAPDGGEALLSEDGGQSWGPAPAEEAARIAELLGGDGPPVATAQGLARWRGAHPPAPGAAAVALLAGNEEVLIAAPDGGTSIARSEDGGGSWQPAAVEGGLRGRVTTIVPASYHMDYVWAGTDAGQLLRSDDRGHTWREVGAEPAPISSLAIVRVLSSS